MYKKVISVLMLISISAYNLYSVNLFLRPSSLPSPNVSDIAVAGVLGSAYFINRAVIWCANTMQSPLIRNTSLSPNGHSPSGEQKQKNKASEEAVRAIKLIDGSSVVNNVALLAMVGAMVCKIGKINVPSLAEYLPLASMVSFPLHACTYKYMIYAAGAYKAVQWLSYSCEAGSIKRGLLKTLAADSLFDQALMTVGIGGLIMQANCFYAHK